MTGEESTTVTTEQQKKRFSFPSAFTILFFLIVLIAAATWFVPAGSYDYDEDGAPIPGTYHRWSQPRRSCCPAP